MTLDQAKDFYTSQIDQSHGTRFAQTVGRFQEGFLADSVTDNRDVAFAKAVDAAKRLLPAIKARA